jgi:hypothetical protein
VVFLALERLRARVARGSLAAAAPMGDYGVRSR